MAVLVTGAAGFIGSSTARALLERGDSVVGIDNLNDYYDVSLKRARLESLARQYDNRFRFERVDFADADALQRVADSMDIDGIVHLGAQAGVRYILENPGAYIQSNLVGHANMLELARHRRPRHMVYASSSSVYGGNKSLPFRVEDRVDQPLSLYAATKKADELLSESYASLFRIPLTGLRFFTVYGPWGRPDMALFMFARNILEGKPIDVFNNGNHKRDFTFVTDIAEGVVRASERTAQADPKWNSNAPDPASSNAPFRIYNIGNNAPVPLMRYIEVLEECLGRKATKNFLPLQLGDVPETFADIDDLVRDVGYRPATSVEEGVRRFVDWFCGYYGYKR
jgi:UDP-glucuronate 4-epimerase